MMGGFEKVLQKSKDGPVKWVEGDTPRVGQTEDMPTGGFGKDKDTRTRRPGRGHRPMNPAGGK